MISVTFLVLKVPPSDNENLCQEMNSKFQGIAEQAELKLPPLYVFDHKITSLTSQFVPDKSG